MPSSDILARSFVFAFGRVFLVSLGYNMFVLCGDFVPIICGYVVFLSGVGMD